MPLEPADWAAAAPGTTTAANAAAAVANLVADMSPLRLVRGYEPLRTLRPNLDHGY
jgi:hypothetical protein